MVSPSAPPYSGKISVLIIIVLAIALFIPGCLRQGSDTGREDGASCSSSSDCTGGNCRYGVCCGIGRSCCGSDVHCPDGMQCGTEHFCNTGVEPSPTVIEVAPSPTIPQPTKVRTPAVAGTFYPGDAKGLRASVSEHLDAAVPADVSGELIALISPHAGFVYSGPVAGYGYSLLEGRSYTTVVVVAPSHRHWFPGISVNDHQRYHTPLGDIEIDMELAAAIVGHHEAIGYEAAAHVQEHSLEVQLPFLQATLGDFLLVPIVMGEHSERNVDILAKSLAAALDGRDDVLLVASTDLSHYLSRERGGALDRTCMASIEKLDDERLLNDLGTEACSMCGGGPSAAVIRASKLLGADTSIILKHGDSGDASRDTSSVVGYLSAAISRKTQENDDDVVTREEKDFLLRLARARLVDVVNGGSQAEKVLEGLTASEHLTADRGCFVTLNKHGDLRGCIGDIIPERSLIKCVLGNARNAALNDRRFRPVTSDELSAIDVEVSVLTPPEVLEYTSPEDLLAKLEPNVHGVVLSTRIGRSTYLPQVWEQLPDKEDFLSRLCTKHGSLPDCWRDRRTTVETYRAVVFGEDT